jgi:hypothetical protein
MARPKAAPAAPAAPAADVADERAAGISISKRRCPAVEADVWDVSYAVGDKPVCDRGFRSEELALAHAQAMADAYGLSVG